MIETIMQTWKTKDLSNASALFQISRDSWEKYNPTWTYQILDDSEIANYVQAHTPHFYKQIYVNYRAQIQRVDIFRIIHQIFDGGIYSDLDAEAVRPFQGDDLESDGIILGSLANKQSLQSIPNAFLYSGKTHGIFWAFVLTEAKKKIPAKQRIRWGPSGSQGRLYSRTAIMPTLKCRLTRSNALF